jgi:hypothetical protein
VYLLQHVILLLIYFSFGTALIVLMLGVSYHITIIRLSSKGKDKGKDKGKGKVVIVLLF